MSFKKSARPLVDVGEQSKNSTTSLFVQNHTSPKHLMEQLETLFVRGELHQADHLIECIIDSNNPLVSTAELFVLHAKTLIEMNGFTVEAQCAIQQALLLEPQYAEAIELQTLSQLHEEFRDGLYEQAQASLRQFMATSESIYASYVLGYHLFWKNGSEAEATELLEACVRERPSFLKAWLCLAMSYKKNKDFIKAEDAFQECLNRDQNPTNLEFYKNHLQSI